MTEAVSRFLLRELLLQL